MSLPREAWESSDRNLLTAAAGLGGGLIGGLRDPMNDLAMMVGPGVEPTMAKALYPLAAPVVRATSDALETGVRQALINMGITAVGEPGHQAANVARGEENGLQPALKDIGMSGLFGFVPGALIGGVKAISSFYGTSARPFIDEFVRQSQAMAPADEPLTGLAKEFTGKVHAWEEGQRSRKGIIYNDLAIGLPRGKPRPQPPRGKFRERL